MRSIVHVAVENFQNHMKSIIELPGPGTLTVVTGPSDSGKTALVSRALRWLFLNQPQGDSFIRHGATYAKVLVRYDDGWVVERERTPSRNQYRLYAPGSASAQVFEGFGSGVPLEVQQVTGVSPVRIGDLDLTLNLSGQLESAFLGSSISSTARARVLGVLAGTEAIDLAAKNVGTDIYRANRDITRLENELKDIEEQKSRLAWVGPMGELLKAVTQLVDKLKDTVARKERLEQLLLKRHELQGRVDRNRDRIEVCERIMAAKKPVQLANEIRQRHAAITSLAARRQGVQSLITKQQAALTQSEATLRARLHVVGAREYAERCGRLRSLIESRNRVETAKKAAAEVALHAWVILDKPKRLVEMGLRPALDRYVKSNSLVYQSLRVLEQRSDAAVTLSSAQRVLLAADLVSRVRDKCRTYSQLDGLIRARRDALDRISNERQQLDAHTRRYQGQSRLEKAYLTALGRCPTCGQVISISA